MNTAPVKVYLEKLGCIVHPNVTIQRKAGGSIWQPALVFTRGEEVGVVEMASTLGLEVMSRADSWSRFADRILVVVPRSARRSKLSPWAQQWGHDQLGGSGIGVLHVRSTTKREQRDGVGRHVAEIRVTWGMQRGADTTLLRAAIAEAGRPK